MAFITLSKLHPKKYFRGLLFCLASAAVLWCSYARVFERFELQTYDWRFRLRGERPAMEDIVHIDIWNDTLEAVGRWPFDRKYHAALIYVLKQFGARAVLFDIEFVESSDSDEMVAQAASDARNVYFQVGFGSPRSIGGRYVDTSIEAPLLPAFEKAAKGIGFPNMVADIDGKRRRVMPVISYQGKDYYQLAFRLVFDYLGVLEEDLIFQPGRYLKIKDGYQVPLDEDGCMILSYAGNWRDTFKHYSFKDIIVSQQQIEAGEKPIIMPEEIKGKICVVGLTAQGSHDVYPNPIEKIFPGVGTFSNTINAILHRDFIVRADRTTNMIILFALACIVCLASFYKKPVVSFLYSLAAITFFVAYAVNLFIYSGLWVDLFFPTAVAIFVYGSVTLYRINREMHKRELIENELKIASQIQQSFLPASPPEQKGLEISVFMKPAKAVGGDLYGFVKLSDEKLGVMVGDVSGKGTPAALFMGKVVSEFKFSARDNLNPSDALTRLNNSIASESTGGLFVTVAYAIFDLKNKTVLLSNGGHLPVVVVRPNKLSEAVLADSGMPIGVMDGVPFSNYEAPIQSGECYAFYSDGISEARNKRKDEYGIEALQKVVADNQQLSSGDILKQAVQAVSEFVGKAEQHDDMTLIVVKIT